MESNFLNLSQGQIVLGIGSNEGPNYSGEPVDSLRKALALLRTNHYWNILKVSPIYESDALLPVNAPDHWNRPYLNAACLIQWNDTNSPFNPNLLLKELQQIENHLGRQSLNERPKWAPRPLDLDILFWSYPSLSSTEITVPHSEVNHRPFAILPVLDILGPQISSTLMPENWWEWLYAPMTDMPQNTRKSQRYFWPKIVGILNGTPDSFSDGNENYLSEEFIDKRISMLASEGAEIIDVGAESTRPSATPISSQVEIYRLEFILPRLESLLASNKRIEVSLDTRHATTMKWALKAFPWIRYINDVESNDSSEKIALLKDSQTKLVFMHSLSVPPRSDLTLPINEDAIPKIKQWAQSQMELYESQGMSRDQLIFDPGIGFGKTPKQNWDIINRISEFRTLRLPLYVGHSRKGFLALPAQSPIRNLESSLTATQLETIDFIRVHEPENTRKALACAAYFNPKLSTTND